MAHTDVKGTLHTYDLAELLGLTTWDDISERNYEHVWEAGDISVRAAREEADGEDIDDESIRDAAECAAETALYSAWSDAVSEIADHMFEMYGMVLRRIQSRPGYWRIVPSGPVGTWERCADEFRATINGVGEFHFATLKEFLESGPYTAREAALSHLGYMRRHYEVYGGQGIRSRFECALDHNMRCM